MKTITAAILIALAALALILAGVIHAESLVTFVETRQDPNVYGRTTYIYAAHAITTPGISHTTIKVPLECYEVVTCGKVHPVTGALIENPDVCEVVDPDPTTGITGVKFDVGLSPPSSIQWWFSVDGDNRIGDSLAATKAGQEVTTFDVLGPVCAPNAVVLAGFDAEQESPPAVAIGLGFLALFGAFIWSVRKHH